MLFDPDLELRDSTAAKVLPKRFFACTSSILVFKFLPGNLVFSLHTVSTGTPGSGSHGF